MYHSAGFLSRPRCKRTGVDLQVQLALWSTPSNTLRWNVYNLSFFQVNIASRKAKATEEQQVKPKRAVWTENVNSGTLSVNKAASVFYIPLRTQRNYLKIGSTVRKLDRQTYLSVA
ncbi:hypothetical protein PR048_024576 [Dryococelus australis]|uniref:Uncharacterized protein n=1 Tax=Dryococelus australis TaxID=614101 RepID=A0ABQ9GP13_9NEOP|nr:hypothetical protein PR048_024576 [Dryococelus australis]